jgi:uncharacterized protein (DUF2267 family)
MTLNSPFLEKVRVKAQLEDIYDARDVTEVVFRTMRDLMTNEASNRVREELQGEPVPTPAEEQQQDVGDLWKDTNPVVSFLSRIRPPLQFDGDTFLFRISQEAGLPRGVTAETAVGAVFSATKEELSPKRSEEIANFLPDKIKQMWVQA